MSSTWMLTMNGYLPGLSTVNPPTTNSWAACAVANKSVNKSNLMIWWMWYIYTKNKIRFDDCFVFSIAGGCLRDCAG